MNKINESQHYVSQVLLRRFTISGRLQSYQVQTEKWKTKGPRKVFAARGYNQLLFSGHADNTLEAAFSKVETPLPKTFEALEKAANTPPTELDQAIYENMCWYCAFLWLTSPFAKAKAAADFVQQIHSEFQHGRADTLREVLNLPEVIIDCYKKAHSLGQRIIIDSANFLQLVYRIQFQRNYKLDYSVFRYTTEWMICNSPIELPVSDIALVQIHRKEDNAVYYILPIGPKLLLKGRVEVGPQKHLSRRLLKGQDLTTDEAEYWLDTICLSAVTELISPGIIPDIQMIRARAKTKGISFPTIVSPELVISAGLTDSCTNFGLRVVSKRSYIDFIRSFIRP